MRTLVLDAGNTRLTGAVAEGGAWETDVWTDIPNGAPDFSDALDRNLAAHVGLPVVLVSVVPAVTDLLRDRRADLRLADHEADLPFASRVPDLAAVGPDRLCNVAAAARAGFQAALVVDLGTASTFDVLKDGVFLGGLIAPGMAFAAEALGQRAARLQPVPFGPRPVSVGTDTADAMAAGAWLTGRGGVLAAIRDLVQAYELTQVQLTGGLGRLLAGPDRPYDPLWTLRGALALAGA